MRQDAPPDGTPLPSESYQGHQLSLLPHGAFRYPVVVDCAEFRLHLTDSSHLPTAWVQTRSAWIHEVGVAAAVASSTRVAERVLGSRLTEPHVSRVDLYADFADWRLTHSDRPGFITHADLRAYFRAGTEEVETIQAGKSPLLMRLYRKDREVRDKGGFAPVFWDGYDGPVTRVELQMGAERLRDFGLASVGEALASLGDLWRYATTEFLELRQEGSGPRETWALRPEWRHVQSVGFDAFRSSGVVPFRVVQGDRVRILRALLGQLTSLAAVDGLTMLAETVDGLPLALRSVARGRSFSAMVERKRARLPRAVREAVLHSPAASAGPGKEAPWAPAPSQEHTRTDA